MINFLRVMIDEESNENSFQEQIDSALCKGRAF